MRETATRALGQLGTATVPTLLIALRDQDSDVRWAAAIVLKAIADPATVPTLCDSLRSQDSYARKVAAEALGESRAAATPDLLIALRDEDSNVRETAVWSLGQIGDAAALPGLLAVLYDRDWGVRIAAVGALEQIGAAAVPGLIEQLSDTAKLDGWRQERICDIAAEALERIATPEALAAVAEWRRREQGDG